MVDERSPHTRWWEQMSGDITLSEVVCWFNENGYRVVKLVRTGGGPSYVDREAFQWEYQIEEEL